MSGFHLVPVGGGDPVHLPPGETVLGRGPLLGVSDKRVSRHHGLLDHQDGRLRLKPIHLNPCFIQASPTDALRPLQKDVWQLLRHGDLISLLPGRLVYRVEATGGEEQADRSNRIFEEEEEKEEKEEEEEKEEKEEEEEEKEEEEEDLPAPPPSGQQGNIRSSSDEAVRKPPEQRGGVAPPKRRVLPAWMVAAAAASRSSASTCSPTGQPAAKRSRGPATPSGGERAAARQAEEAELSEEEAPKKRRRKTDNEVEEEEEEAVQSRTEVPTVTEPSRSELSDESDGEDEKQPPAARRVEPVGSKGGAAAPRAACPYGKDCYRKNPVHFQECSHPGDTDYQEEDEEDDEDRPECVYGTDCYRKNPLHRREYRHTQRPASTRRAAAKQAAADDGDEDEDFGDDDSFINDDSEDAGDDSDYAPPAESDDSGKEDVRRLQREAKAFLRKRK